MCLLHKKCHVWVHRQRIRIEAPRTQESRGRLLFQVSGLMRCQKPPGLAGLSHLPSRFPSPHTTRGSKRQTARPLSALVRPFPQKLFGHVLSYIPIIPSFLLVSNLSLLQQTGNSEDHHTLFLLCSISPRLMSRLCLSFSCLPESIVGQLVSGERRGGEEGVERLRVSAGLVEWEMMLCMLIIFFFPTGLMRSQGSLRIFPVEQEVAVVLDAR